MSADKIKKPVYPHEMDIRQFLRRCKKVIKAYRMRGTPTHSSPGSGSRNFELASDFFDEEEGVL
jgi:hypothetical protein